MDEEKEKFILKCLKARNSHKAKVTISMYITGGKTGVGWAIFGIALIWGS